MAISQVQDVTTSFNQNHAVIIDIGGWDFVVVQLIGPSTTVSFTTSNDSGDIEGISIGGPASAANFIAVTGTNLATALGITSIAAAGLIKFSGIGRYLQLAGTSVTATKVLVRFFKTY